MTLGSLQDSVVDERTSFERPKGVFHWTGVVTLISGTVWFVFKFVFI